MCKVSPQATNEQRQYTQKEDWASSPDHRKRIGEEAGYIDGEDAPAKTTVQGVVRHVPVLGHLCVARRDHGALKVCESMCGASYLDIGPYSCSNDSGVDADEKQHQVFLPQGPVEWIIQSTTRWCWNRFVLTRAP